MISPYAAPGLRDNYKALFAEQKAAKIIKVICEYYGEDIDFVMRKTRIPEVIKARYLCMYFVRKQTNLNLKTIGGLFGHKYDHTTVLHALQYIKGQISLPFDNEIKTDFMAIINLL